MANEEAPFEVGHPLGWIETHRIAGAAGERECWGDPDIGPLGGDRPRQAQDVIAPARPGRGGAGGCGDEPGEGRVEPDVGQLVEAGEEQLRERGGEIAAAALLVAEQCGAQGAGVAAHGQHGQIVDGGRPRLPAEPGRAPRAPRAPTRRRRTPRALGRQYEIEERGAPPPDVHPRTLPPPHPSRR
ncbi:MAG: hypothetical protein QOI16_1773 [Pseudonocardiales bacterium]|nr:hypothetical protein [Pseudonocardiales bacterium]